MLRPEGAGATGDVAWQGWGRFGRKIGRKCRRADAFIAISKAIEKEIETAWASGTMRNPDDRHSHPAHARPAPNRVDP